MQATANTAIATGAKVRVGVRPEHVEPVASEPGAADGECFPAEIISQTFLGDRRTYTIKLGDGYLSARGDPEVRLSGAVNVRIQRHRASCFVDEGPGSGFITPAMPQNDN